MKPIVAVVIPATEWMYSVAVEAFFGLQDVQLVRLLLHPHAIVDKRNLAVEEFLKTPATHLLQIDSDMLPRGDLAQRLLATGRDIVGALYYERSSPCRPMAGFDNAQRVEGTGQGVKLVDWVGAGALLVARGVFEALPPPWFSTYREVGTAEDIFFCAQARSKGWSVFVDTTTVVDHIGIAAVNARNRELFATAGGGLL